MSYDEILITGVIVAIVLWVAIRTGQSNPIGTGKVSRRLSAVESKVAEQSQKINAIDDALKSMSTTGERTSKQIAELRVEVAADRGVTERTWSAVDRLQNFFIQDSFDRKRADK